jgi:hypothetical protein
LLSVIVLFEFYTGPQQLISPAPRAVDRWLADRDERVTIIQMPLAVALSGPQMYYTMHHGQRLASGYGTYLPVLIEREYPDLGSFPSDRSLDLLARWGDQGVTYILVDEAGVPADDPLWPALDGQDRLDQEVVLDGVRVYALR